MDSLPAFIEITNVMPQAMPQAKVEWIDGGHIINPAHPAVLAYVDELLRKEEPFPARDPASGQPALPHCCGVAERRSSRM
jgi:hypothetical protein